MAHSQLSYAGVAGGDDGSTVPGKPNVQAAQWPKNGAAIQQPAYHLHQLYGRSILLDWKALASLEHPKMMSSSSSWM